MYGPSNKHACRSGFFLFPVHVGEEFLYMEHMGSNVFFVSRFWSWPSNIKFEKVGVDGDVEMMFDVIRVCYSHISRGF